MRKLFHDSQHLVRMAGLFVIGTTAFFVVRAMMIPDDFGVYGHFRAGAIDDNARRVLAYAGREACAECHEEEFDTVGGNRHAGVHCESCHGPLAAHAADPMAELVELPKIEQLCLRCHSKSTARPAFFPQVDSEHSEGESCDACHQSHQPAF